MRFCTLISIYIYITFTSLWGAGDCFFYVMSPFDFDRVGFGALPSGNRKYYCDAVFAGRSTCLEQVGQHLKYWKNCKTVWGPMNVFPLTLTVSDLARSKTGSSIETQFLAICCPRMEQASHCFRMFVYLSFICFEYHSNIQSPTEI